MNARVTLGRPWYNGIMYKNILTQVGLSGDEAEVYESLVTSGPVSASDLLKHVKMKRGLLYKVIDRLMDRKLVRSTGTGAGRAFTAESPDKILDISEKIMRNIQQSHESLKKSIPELKAKYVLSNEKPIIRFFEGKDGLQSIYEDRLTTGAKEQYLIRTADATAYRDMFGKWFSYFLRRRVELGMKTYAITPDDHTASSHNATADKERNVSRTWVRVEDYSAPVEISSYGNKVSVVSFGKEVFGLVIENEPFAHAIRDLFRLAEKGAKTIQVDHDHPLIKDL